MSKPATRREPKQVPRLVVLCERCSLGCSMLLSGCFRVLGAAFVLAAIATGMMVHMLKQGAVPLPGLAEIAAAAVNGEGSTSRIEIGSAYLAITRRDRPALRFGDVQVRDVETGELLIAVPRLGARFSVPDLLRGQVEPIGITVIEPKARLVRLADGRFSFGLGIGPASAPGASPEEGAAPENAGFAAVSRLLDALAGLTPRPQGAQKLRRVAIHDAELILRNQATGSAYTSRGADLLLRANDRGIRLDLGLPVRLADGSEVEIKAEGRRRIGATENEIRVDVAGLRLDQLAAEIPELAWAAPLVAPVSGHVEGVVHGDGKIGGIETALKLGQGALIIGPDLPVLPIRTAELVAAFDPSTGRLALERMSVDGPLARMSVSGTVGMEGTAGGLPERVSAELRLSDLALDMPGALPGPLAFESGSLVFLAEPAVGRYRIAEASLGRGPLTFVGSGTIEQRADAESPSVAFRATANGLTVEDVKTLWPEGAGGNARPWFVENIKTGKLPELLAQVALGPEGEHVAVDFSFEDVTSTYLAALPPIVDGSGRAHLTADAFDLELDEGHVDVTGRGAGRIEIGGSRLRIYDFEAPITPADIALEAEGPIGAVLSLIDQEPLGLVSRLGLPLQDVAGRARVSTDLAFPLLAALKVEEVEADARADLRGISLSMPVEEGERMTLASDALSLSASTEALQLSGAVEAFGARLETLWTERYGAVPGRALSLSGQADAALLGQLGVELPGLGDESFPVAAELQQSTDGPMQFELEADLTPVSLDPPIDWRKSAGSPGTLAVQGSLGGGMSVDRLALVAGDLELSASAAFDAEGQFANATLERLVVDDRADLNGSARREEAGGYAVELGGRMLDIGLLGGVETGPGGGGVSRVDGVPLAIVFNLDSLALAEGIEVKPAGGMLRQEPGEGASMSFSGRLNALAPASGTVSLPAGEPGKISLRTEDAGAFLRALELASEAQGGTLAIDATLVDGGLDEIRGKALAERLRLTEGSTVQKIFVEGGAGEVLDVEGARGGISFRRIEVPFVFKDNVITVEDAVATGPALAIRIGGTIDQDDGTVDMSGVASPAYAVSGFLNDIPLLGRVLTGERGEGLLGLTFDVSGPIEDPKLSVNPLSLLAPGILRELFTGRPPGRTGGKAIEPSTSQIEERFGRGN
ncbi:MAG: AsmA-like C-terminal domain-containing protein [Pseudomonadota bacterium]